MTFAEALKLVNAALQSELGRSLSDLETLVFEGAWQGKTYPQIAEEAGYSMNYLTTDVGPKFWKMLSQALGESVNKKNFKAALQRSQEDQRFDETGHLGESSQATPLITRPSLSAIHWGEAPAVDQFYGREEEQAILHRWIGRERCRLIAILGMGGIGKSTLAARVALQFASGNALPTGCESHFTHIIWRSLRNAPPLSTLLVDLVSVISDCQAVAGELSQLLYWFRESPCLVVLDNAETILQSGGHAGYYREGYDDYGELIRLLGETVHQSCVILTSREKPAEIAALEGLEGGTRTLQLSGSVETALSLIAAKELVGTQEQRLALCDRYSYNPLALKIVATTIQDLFERDIGAFLAEDVVIFNSIRRLLDQQFQRLTDLEQGIMRWLAINRDWTELGELMTDLVPAVSKVSVVEALESLKWRGLIESQKNGYTQQPVVMEYVTEQLIEQAIHEFSTVELHQWHRYALMKTTSRDYVTDTQIRLILTPIAHQIRAQFTAGAALAQQVMSVLAAMRTAGVALGYGAGNLLNLCKCLTLDLTHFDFSNLTIRQADLRRRILQQVNFNRANFYQVAWTETFGSIFSLGYSQDGNTLITGDNVGNVRFWRSDDLQPLGSISAHRSYIWHLLPSPNQRYLATCSEDHTVRIWHMETRQQQGLLELSDTIAQALAWIDSERLAIGSIDGNIRLWSPLSGELKCLAGHQGIVSGLSWNCHSKTLASSSTDGTVKLWDMATDQCLKTLAEHEGPVRDVAWSPDGTLLVSGGEDYAIVLYALPQAVPIKKLQGHSNTVWSVEWSPDGQYLSSSSQDATIRLWDVARGSCLQVLKGHQNWVWYARWHPTRSVMASGSHDGTLKLWNPETGHCLKTLLGHMSNAWVLALSPDGETLAGGCNDMVLRLWQPQNPNPFHHLIGHSHMIADVGWSPKGDYLVSASHDRTVRVWQVATRQCLTTLTGHHNWVWSVDWHPREDLLASASSDNTIKLWHPFQVQPIKTLTEHTHWALAVRWHPEGKWLASCAADKTVRLWQPESWDCCHVLTEHDHWIWRLAWEPSGHRLASGGYDHTVRLWQVDDTAVRCIQVLHHTGIVSAIAWHPMAHLLATGCHDSTICLWQPQTGECVARLQGHGNQVSSLVFSAEGRWLYSSSEDETLKVWDVAKATCLSTARIDRPYEGMNITGITGLTPAQQQSLMALGAVTSRR